MKAHEARVHDLLDPIIMLGADVGSYMKFRWFLEDVALKASKGNRSAKEIMDFAERFSKLVKIGTE